MNSWQLCWIITPFGQDPPVWRGRILNWNRLETTTRCTTRCNYTLHDLLHLFTCMGVPYSFIYPFTMTDRLTPQSRVSGSWKLTWNNLLIELNGYAWRRLIEGTKRYVSWFWLTVSGDDRLQTDRRKSCVIPTRIRRFSHSPVFFDLPWAY